LNNNGDGLKLIQPGGKIIDSVEYEKAPRGKSFNRVGPDWTWGNVLSPGEANVIPTLNKDEEIEKGVSGTEARQEENKFKTGLAATVSLFQGEEMDKKISKSFLPQIAALILAIFSGLAILTLKISLRAKRLKEDGLG
jgi:hypothetical protein